MIKSNEERMTLMMNMSVMERMRLAAERLVKINRRMNIRVSDKGGNQL